MKILLYSDNHWSQYSSIVRKRGELFSVRLENQIKSINWAMQLAVEQHCFATFCLGDFFDKAELNAEEIAALKEVKWAPMSNYFICGNHEMMSINHDYSSAKVFDLLDTGEVITVPKILNYKEIEICILPYILEADRKPLCEYFPQTTQKRIILSHNDIAGIQMGKFVSDTGFSIDEIEANCNLFINGHLHNGEKISNKIINIGNLTGQNFSEDALKYEHCAFIIDTETLKVEVYENPYAFNFYKIDVTHRSELDHLTVKQNAICTIKCNEQDTEQVKAWIAATDNIIESRLTIVPKIQVVTDEVLQEDLAIDHLQAFKDYILNNLENTKELIEELTEVLINENNI